MLRAFLVLGVLVLWLPTARHSHATQFECRVPEFCRLVKPHGLPGDEFGYALAVGPELALLGAPQDDTAGPNAGAVHVYRRFAAHWQHDGPIAPSAPSSSGLFGAAISLWGDSAVVGAPGAGQVYFLRRFAGGWIEEARYSGGASFGQAVGIYGELAVVGDPRAIVQGVRSGVVYVYQREWGRWRLDAVLQAADAHADQNFGTAVAIWQDTLLVGASLDDALGQAAGAAYVFRRAGSVWRQEAKLVGWDLSCCAFFGEAVGLQNDLAVCGARRAIGLAPLTGAAYLFRYDGNSWVPCCKLAASDGFTFDDFGCSVAVWGRTVVVGARRNRDSGTRSGSAYVYQISNCQCEEVAKVVPSDGRDGDYFGSALAIAGGSLLVGAFQADPAGSNSGAAYVYGGMADCNGNNRLDACDILLGVTIGWTLVTSCWVSVLI